MILLSNDYWEVKNTKRKGRGLFAKKDIAKGTIIGDYLGKIIHPKDAIIDEENFYLMYYHDRAVITPDLEKPGVHLLNHACVPNAWLYTYKGHTLAFSLRKISKKEELTIPYLLSPKDEFCNPCPHFCRCGNKQCSKTMHLSKEKYSRWKILNEKWAGKTKRERIRYGKELPTLSVYPKTISQNYINEVNQLFKFRSML
jgi:SET domain-containing protein